MKYQKYLYTLLGILVLITIFVRYEEYIVRENFDVYAHIPCNPNSEACFAADCNPDGDIECDAIPYKKVTIHASTAPQCIFENNCQEFSCPKEGLCKISLCNAGAISQGEKCYTANGGGKL